MSISQLTQSIVSVALGQDHTLAVTKSGEVLSWGLNRFSQLGYIIEPSSTGSGISLGRSEEPVQASPRKIFGPLKKEVVRGVAACKTASACWTDGEVFTWGTNHGQLGERTFLAHLLRGVD
jgi:alpha-tubulin suppressor-like RCC1 family protein